MRYFYCVVWDDYPQSSCLRSQFGSCNGVGGELVALRRMLCHRGSSVERAEGVACSRWPKARTIVVEMSYTSGEGNRLMALFGSSIKIEPADRDGRGVCVLRVRNNCTLTATQTKSAPPAITTMTVL
eukprot:gb/GECG01001061.1/.p1 GENE.gb/GECG01001061.1/~~gb/GECG01001061.1/.p1  ORF type:complete len:127 (+),score=3.90 gb/GECG01001061.1/:1-381(+)